VGGEARVSVKNASKVLRKKDKKAMQQQMSKNKKMAMLDRKRFGTIEGAPKTVVFIFSLLSSLFIVFTINII